MAHVINSVTSSFEGQETSVAWISSRQRNKTEEPHINAEHLPWLTPKLLLLSGSYLVDCKDAGLGLEDVAKTFRKEEFVLVLGICVGRCGCCNEGDGARRTQLFHTSRVDIRCVVSQ